MAGFWYHAFYFFFIFLFASRVCTFVHSMSMLCTIYITTYTQVLHASQSYTFANSSSEKKSNFTLPDLTHPRFASN